MQQHNRKGTVHIIGGGLAGLAAAIAIDKQDYHVELYESSAYFGGRCRSYHDTQLGCELDNGNHLVLGANHNVFDYLKQLGAKDELVSLENGYPFVNIKSGERWQLKPPLYLGRQPIQTLKTLLPILFTRQECTIGNCVDLDSQAAKEWLIPFVESALNTPVADSSATIFRRLLIRSVLRGTKAMRPFVPRHSLGKTFIDPALSYLEKKKHKLYSQKAIKTLHTRAGRVEALATHNDTIKLGDTDTVIIATPAHVIQKLLPGIHAPTEHCAILNVHFHIKHTLPSPMMLGVIGGVSQWLFTRRDIIASTTSAANYLLNENKDTLAQRIWQEAHQAFNIHDSIPPYRVVWEKRATFSCAMEQQPKRPSITTEHSNLFLAGDYTDTGLPATIEGAIQSGFAAAHAIT